MNNASVVLQTSGLGCDMQAVDFDEDGDLDLLLGHSGIWISTQFDEYVDPPRFRRYFERISDELEERIGEENPLAAFGGQVVWIADLDGDARLDVLATEDIRKQPDSLSLRWDRCRYFRRTAAGSFVEPSENPLAFLLSNTSQMMYADLSALKLHSALAFYLSNTSQMMQADLSALNLRSAATYELHVADWNSDGLPDVLRLEVLLGVTWKLEEYFQHLVDTELKYNYHVNTYEDIHAGKHLGGADTFSLVDWNRDGFQDVVVMRSFSKSRFLQLYEFDGQRMKEVEGVFDNVTFGSVLGGPYWY